MNSSEPRLYERYDFANSLLVTIGHSWFVGDESRIS